MTQTEQSSAVWNQGEQIDALVVMIAGTNTVCQEDYSLVARHIKAAEARGAAEQRRKDAEGQEPVPQVQLTDGFITVDAEGRIPLSGCMLGAPDGANVAALGARIAELEGENSTLKKRVMNAAETLLSIETPCMEGDNFAVTICSHFEDCEGEPCDNGWHPKATEAYEEIKTAIARHFRAALTREGGV